MTLVLRAMLCIQRRRATMSAAEKRERLPSGGALGFGPHRWPASAQVVAMAMRAPPPASATKSLSAAAAR
jgi:hypothetical protein